MPSVSDKTAGFLAHKSFAQNGTEFGAFTSRLVRNILSSGWIYRGYSIYLECLSQSGISNECE